MWKVNTISGIKKFRRNGYEFTSTPRYLKDDQITEDMKNEPMLEVTEVKQSANVSRETKKKKSRKTKKKKDE